MRTEDSGALVLPGGIPGLLRRGSPVIGAISNAPGVVVEIEEGRAVIGRWFGGAACILGPIYLGGIYLDLTDATGRAHASWWTLDRFPSGGPDMLEGLDPDDPRTLPDGSRWVDAEALRRVVLHAAGLEP